MKFLSYIKSILIIINIHNCNINLAILLSLMLYLPDKHFFNYNELLKMWNLNNEEIKFILFLVKKKLLITV